MNEDFPLEFSVGLGGGRGREGLSRFIAECSDIQLNYKYSLMMVNLSIWTGYFFFL